MFAFGSRPAQTEDVATEAAGDVDETMVAAAIGAADATVALAGASVVVTLEVAAAAVAADAVDGGGVAELERDEPLPPFAIP